MKLIDKAVLAITCVWFALVIGRASPLSLLDIAYVSLLVVIYYGIDAVGASLLRQLKFMWRQLEERGTTNETDKL